METTLAMLDDIAEAEATCVAAEESVETCKAKLKEAKATYDMHVARLRRLAKAIRNDADRPLFGQPTKSDPEARLEEPITSLGLSAGLNERLYDAGVNTIGNLEELRSEITMGREKWPKGIGEAKVTIIEDAVLTWLANNPIENGIGNGEATENGEASEKEDREENAG